MSEGRSLGECRINSYLNTDVFYTYQHEAIIRQAHQRFAKSLYIKVAVILARPEELFDYDIFLPPS